MSHVTCNMTLFFFFFFICRPGLLVSVINAAFRSLLKEWKKEKILLDMFPWAHIAACRNMSDYCPISNFGTRRPLPDLQSHRRKIWSGLSGSLLLKHPLKTSSNTPVQRADKKTKKQKEKAYLPHLSHVICHLSSVRCHMPCVPCHM